MASIADWNGVAIDQDSLEFGQPEEKKEKNGGRRPDKAENVMMVSGLPVGTEETKFREWLGDNLPQELIGLVYHLAMVEDGGSCYVSFITHKAMREAKSKLNHALFKPSKKVTVSAEDITRKELVATALNITIEEDDGIPPLSFWLSKADVV